MNERPRVSKLLPMLVVPVLIVALAACAPSEEPGPGCPAEAPSPMPAQPYAQDPELADRVPDEVAGQPLEIQTVCATVYDPGGLTTSDTMLERVGVARQDVTLALSPPPSTGGTNTYVAVNAWRYAGADEGTIRDAFVGLLEEAEVPVEEDTIAGKDVHMAFFHAYYVADDTLYAVLGEEARVEEVLEALP